MLHLPNNFRQKNPAHNCNHTASLSTNMKAGRQVDVMVASNFM